MHHDTRPLRIQCAPTTRKYITFHAGNSSHPSAARDKRYEPCSLLGTKIGVVVVVCPPETDPRESGTSENSSQPEGTVDRAASSSPLSIRSYHRAGRHGFGNGNQGANQGPERFWLQRECRKTLACGNKSSLKGCASRRDFRGSGTRRERRQKRHGHSLR